MEEIKINNKSFYNYLLENGYYFDKEMIENYLLSLKVKPFTILTGNSGTGKTKLSQLFAKYITDYTTFTKDENISESQINDEGYVTVKVKTNYSSWKNTGWTLRKTDFTNILPILESQGNFTLEVNEITTPCYINVLPQLYYDKHNNELKNYFRKLYNENQNQLVDMKIDVDSLKEFMSKDYIESNGEIILQQTSNKSAIESRQWHISNKYFEYIPFDSGYTKCKIVVGGISADAKIRLVPKLSFSPNGELQSYLEANLGENIDLKIKGINFNFKDFKPKWETDDTSDGYMDNSDDNLIKIDNYKIVPVGANWTENRNIVGYYNLITEEYQSTPAYDLINQSKDNLESPHFLILDEMNLSHVERYFADFLSAIESGESIPLYGIEDDLEIPNNLFIIGTVNVDETTYMFSPKVLDRANVLEFETYSSKDYMLGNINLNAPEGNISYLENPLIDSDIRNLGINELKESFAGVKVQNIEFWDLLSDEIFKFQTILKESGFDFGFRVINEIVRFMLVAWRYEGEPTEWTNWERYFDAQIKQKLLPKLYGSEKILGDTLKDLAEACVDDEKVKYYTSAKKLKEMMEVLDKQRYVSFIN